MRICATESQVVVWTPAKINLFLEILGRRDDGLHEIETVMASIALYDTLMLEVDPTGQVAIRVRDLLSGPAARGRSLTF